MRVLEINQAYNDPLRTEQYTEYRINCNKVLVSSHVRKNDDVIQFQLLVFMQMFSICGAELNASLLVQSSTVAVNVIQYRQL